MKRLVVLLAALAAFVVPAVASATTTIQSTGSRIAYAEGRNTGDNTSGYTYGVKFSGTHTLFVNSGDLADKTISGFVGGNYWADEVTTYLEAKSCSTCTYHPVLDDTTGGYLLMTDILGRYVNPHSTLTAVGGYTLGGACTAPYVAEYTYRMVRTLTLNAYGWTLPMDTATENGNYVYPPAGFTC